MDQTESQDELYQKAAQEYGEALARMVCAYEADPELRRELSQEIHLALWRSLAKFNGHCARSAGNQVGFSIRKSPPCGSFGIAAECSPGRCTRYTL